MRTVRDAPVKWGPANTVTLVRAALVGVVTLLVAGSFVLPVSVRALVALAGVALALDAVDGWVARRTNTVSEFGARFDMEVDAFLILVLSVYVAPRFGAWVLLIGLARYAFGALARQVPWLRAAMPPSYFRKTVAVVQGVVLTVAAAGVLADELTSSLLVVALVLLGESFGQQVWWLAQHRTDTARITVDRMRSHAPVA